MKTPTLREIEQWLKCPTINPQTRKKIKQHGKTYMAWLKAFEDARKQPTNQTNFDKMVQYNKCKATQQYIQYRQTNTEVFTMEPIPSDQSMKSIFKFYHQWDPYNGTRTTIDPMGPLLFDANALIHYWYVNRLNHLWHNAVDEAGGLYHGYYGDGVGNGPLFNITGRGNHMDWYLFRLPIMDCYLPDDHNEQFVTMGPILTNDEISMVYKLAKKSPYEFGPNRPNVVMMKAKYEQAITMKPTIPGFTYDVSAFITKDQWDELRFEENKKGVTALMMM